MESIGVYADSIERCKEVFSVIRGKDSQDQSSCNPPEQAPPLSGGGSKRIGVLSPQALTQAMAVLLQEAAKNSGDDAGRALRDAAGECMPDENLLYSFEEVKKRLTVLGHSLTDVTVSGLQYAVPAFYTIAAADSGCNLARFDAMTFGTRPDWAENHDELMDKARETGFGQEAKLQAILGTLALRSGFQDRYYLKAHRIRAGIKAQFEALLGDSEYKQPAKIDAILMPVYPVIGKTLSPLAQRAARVFTCCASLAGLPALAFPGLLTEIEMRNLPAGIQLIGRAWAEGILFDIAQGYAEKYPFPHPQGFKEFWK